MNQIANFTAHPSSQDLFMINGKALPRTYQLDPFRNHIDHLYVVNVNDRKDYCLRDWKLSEIQVEGQTFSTIEDLSIYLAPLIYASGNSGMNNLSQNIQDLISLTQSESDETQELLKEIPLIPVDFELGEGTYDKSNILTGHYSGSETKIHSIQVLSQEAGAFSLRFVGDVNHDFNEITQQVKAVKNQELADFELVVNAEYKVTVNIELLTI